MISDDQAGTSFDHVRRRAPARHDVRSHGAIQHFEAFRRIERPERLPLGDVVTTPDVVDQNVDAPALADDSREQRRHVVRIAVISAHGNSATAGGRYEFCSSLRSSRCAPVSQDYRACSDRCSTPSRPLHRAFAQCRVRPRGWRRQLRRPFRSAGGAEAMSFSEPFGSEHTLRPFAFTNGRALSEPQRHNRQTFTFGARRAQKAIHRQSGCGTCSQRTHATCARICSNFAS